MSQRTRPAEKNQGRHSSGVKGGPPGGRRRRRTNFLAPPPNPFGLSGWALLPLRAFLGFTFTFAGLQKLANPNFLNANSPSSIQAQLIASIRVSPVHFLLGHLLRFAVPIAILIALSELAVGMGALLGLWTRAAAASGMALSLTLFLTVSFHSSPYYTGADIVFFFAWIPLLLAGAGGVLSLDAQIASRVATESKTGAPGLVPVRFALVQEVCGHYAHDTCTAQAGRPCDVYRCPFLTDERGSVLQRGPDAIDRRTLVLGGTAVAASALAGAVAAGATAGIGRAVGGAKAPAASAAPLKSATNSASNGPKTTVARSAGTPIGRTSQVPVGGAASFQDPATGDPALIVQLTKGQFVAYDAVCPHAGCTVGYSQAAKLIVCPCHGSEFDPTTGDVISPPAPRGLTPIHVAVSADGQILADG
ncbi:MAG TPA: Rieske 2Fe-2S domain-containing protein [Acidimicrobiales bacterium]|nr:Rieske 2Fe-2S domain-containing protein [Acidimicrobiales bacterium]